MNKYTHIIWDWNGTLLDDVEWCIISMNTMLKKRGLPMIDSREAYYQVFGFPVKDYYRRVGFDFEKEPFEKLAVEYIDIYHSSDNSVTLFPDVKEVLCDSQQKGLRQIILSASELNNLLMQMKPFNIDTYFDEILGISDIFATSKISMGKSYIERVKPQKTVLIGDTIHDKEVANALGVDCILIANGHQSKNTLLSYEAIVVNDITDVSNILELSIDE